jgi:hypothetical protein
MVEFFTGRVGQKLDLDGIVGLVDPLDHVILLRRQVYFAAAILDIHCDCVVLRVRRRARSQETAQEDANYKNA